MKVSTKQQNVTSVNTGAEHTAKIKASPKAFHILSGALYSDRVLAVVRELCCNASDAHVAANNTKTPFELKLPSNWDNTFYVKDFGTGISEENIYEMYMTYFESTKTDSNDFIGQLGLGSKSPFSYGATFTVESRQGGIKKTYTCYKNAELMPSVSLMDTAPTDEPNGLTVALSVKPDDVHKFVNAAKHALMYVKVQPKVVGVSGFEVYPVVYERVLGKCKQRTRHNVYDGPRVIQGAVSYPVDLEVVKDMVQSKKDVSMLEHFKYMDIDIMVDIGDVEVAPSREALSYDLRTSMAIYDILMDASAQFYTAVQKEINDCDNLWNANVLYRHIRSTYVGGDSYRSGNLIDIYQKQHGKFTYNGAELGLSVKIGGKDATWIPKQINAVTSFGSYRPDHRLEGGTAYSFKDGVSINVTPSDEYVIVLDDVHNNRIRRKALGAYLTRHSIKSHTQWKGIIIQPNVEKGALDQKEVDKFVKLLGGPPVVKLSSLPVPANTVATSTYKPKAKDEVMVYEGQNDTNYGSRPLFGRSSWSTQQIDLSEGGYYFNVDRYDIMDSGFKRDRLDKILETAFNLGILDKTLHIIGANEKKKAIILSAGGKPWINVIDHITKEFIKMVKTHNVVEVAIATNFVSRMRVYNRSVVELFDNWKPEYSAIDNAPLQTFKKAFDDAVKIKDDCVLRWAEDLNNRLMTNYVFNSGCDADNKIASFWNAVTDICPMVQFINLERAAVNKDGTKLIITALTV